MDKDYLMIFGVIGLIIVVGYFVGSRMEAKRYFKMMLFGVGGVMGTIYLVAQVNGILGLACFVLSIFLTTKAIAGKI